MRKDFIRKVCKGFRPRLSRVIAAEEGRIVIILINVRKAPLSKCKRTLEQPGIILRNLSINTCFHKLVFISDEFQRIDKTYTIIYTNNALFA